MVKYILYFINDKNFLIEIFNVKYIGFFCQTNFKLKKKNYHEK
jgi:hypothetical protein